ncbi:MAG: creatininase family protein [Candidatus Omnitrophica bacterium]|nr:creatininase family protein [Candidatus Omnitrophota bacterium]MCM8802098.1 creatininase family protein [Candidatus Omnitrophota bacterium]
MRYEMMFADDLRKAIKNNIPFVIPVGVLEYHSEHCVFGVDTILIIKALEIMEKEMDIVICPPFYYGSASYAVEPPENNGTIHITSNTVYIFAKDLFKSMLRIGIRNIHIFIHHQSENFVDGMPTDLAFKLAARESIFEYLEKEYGEGWWGKEQMREYYKMHKERTDPFRWIKIHPFIDEETQKKFPIDHAGKQETSLMLAFCPEGVDMKKFKEKWYSEGAKEASLEYGLKAKEIILKKMKERLTR